VDRLDRVLVSLFLRKISAHRPPAAQAAKRRAQINVLHSTTRVLYAGRQQGDRRPHDWSRTLAQVLKAREAKQQPFPRHSQARSRR